MVLLKKHKPEAAESGLMISKSRLSSSSVTQGRDTLGKLRDESERDR